MRFQSFRFLPFLKFHHPSLRMRALNLRLDTQDPASRHDFSASVAVTLFLPPMTVGHRPQKIAAKFSRCLSIYADGA